MICQYCDEEIEPGDERADILNADLHHACGARLAIGSVAHIARRCSCYVPGAEDGDPPGVSKRQGAELAYILWSILQRYEPTV